MKFRLFVSIFITLLLGGCISISNSGYDQARLKQDGKVFTDLVDSKAAASVDTTGEDIGTAVRAAAIGN